VVAVVALAAAPLIAWSAYAQETKPGVALHARGTSGPRLLLSQVPRGSTDLARRLRATLAEECATAACGAVAVDLRNGMVVFAEHERMPLAPASTEKLLVAFAALADLGPSARVHTKVAATGRRRGDIWQGDLILEGHGDPTLSSARLADLAEMVRRRGIDRVAGSVVGDESFFDRRRVGPRWKPSFYEWESPPLSALAVDRAMIDGRTAPQPALAAAVLFRRALNAAGISVDGPARAGRSTAAAPILASASSPPLKELVYEMNKTSDNYTAELLLKELGATEAHSGTSSAGADAIAHVLTARGIPLTHTSIDDGSGLSTGDRSTVATLAGVLLAASRDRRIFPALSRSLPIAGVDGTLRHHLTSGAGYRTVRAKTGTLDDASALAGYAGDHYAFAVLVNQPQIQLPAAWRAEDAFARTLAAAR
jgi:D-alanyl-D-alanine carboxypeptidase/D-alanyl-D-alanine-endopeptidase (penicillin-binding protein 4)